MMIMRWLKTGVIWVGLFLMGYAVGTGDLPTNAQDDDLHQVIFDPLFQAYDLVDRLYLEDVDDEVLINGAIRGMLNGLGDPYTNYVEPEYWEFVSGDLDGSVEGIGVMISAEENGAFSRVVNVLKGTPAEKSGVQVGDIFHQVNGEDVMNLNNLELASRVRGPAGTVVNIIFKRGDDFVTLDIERARFESPNVEYHVIEEQNLAYISMSQFTSLSHMQVLQALEALDVNNREGLIFDLRGNGGGYLSAAIDIGALFIEEGIILREQFSESRYMDFEIIDGQAYRVDMDGNKALYSNRSIYADIQVPIVVLVDNRSASASELVSGAWQDYAVATLIGDVTFGKGTVQTQQQLMNGGGVRITQAKWLTPKLEWITDIGITPDILVTVPEDHDIETDGDIQLERAIAFLLGDNADD